MEQQIGVKAGLAAPECDKAIMNIIPENWIDEWVYGETQGAGNSSLFFHWKNDPLWMIVGRLENSVYDFHDGESVSIDDYNSCIERLYDVAKWGDCLSRTKAILSLEDFVRFEPEFIAIVRGLYEKKIILFKQDKWSERMIEISAIFARGILYRLETFGEERYVAQPKKNGKGHLKEIDDHIRQNRESRPPIWQSKLFSGSSKKGIPLPPRKQNP